MTYWLEAINNGLSTEDLLTSFYDSDEFNENNDSLKDMDADRDFLIKLYDVVLHREADDGGLVYYETDLGEGQINRREVFVIPIPLNNSHF